MGRSHKPAQRLTRCPSSAPLGRNPRTRTHHPRRGRLGQIFTCAKDCTASVRSRRLDDAAAAHPIWHRSGQKSRLRAPRAVLQSGARVSSGKRDRRASPPSRGRGSLRHVAFHTHFRRTRALSPVADVAGPKAGQPSGPESPQRKGHRTTREGHCGAVGGDDGREFGRRRSLRVNLVD